MIQRRTFLGGLLAAVAASAALPKTMVTVQSVAEAEKKILQVFPEPEEGYTLFIKPGYDLPMMKVKQGVSLDLEHPAPLMIQGVTWEPPGYRSMKVNVEVEGEHAETLRAWFTKMIEGVNSRTSIFDSPAKEDYAGIATFGPVGDPLVKLEGLFPTQIDYQYITKPDSDELTLTARAEFQFDWVHQKVL